MNVIWICPVCGGTNESLLFCNVCGFDLRKNYRKYPFVMNSKYVRITNIREKQQEFQKRQLLADFEIERDVLKKYTGNESIVKIPDGIKAISSYAFLGCKQLKKIIMSDSVQSIGYSAFAECESLDEVIFSSNIKWIELQTFRRCISLKKIVIPDSVKEIANLAFQDCKNLEEVTLSKNIREISLETFVGCECLKKIIIPDSVENIDVWIDSMKKVSGSGYLFYAEKFYYKGKYINNKQFSAQTTNAESKEANGKKDEFQKRQLLVDFEIERNILKKYTGNESIVKIPDGIKIISSHAFIRCKHLKKIVMPNSVGEIQSSAFAECESLEEVIFSSNIEWIGLHVFRNCIGLKKVIIPDSVKKIAAFAFQGCKNLEEVTLSKNIREIFLRTFAGCDCLKKIIIPDSVENIDIWLENMKKKMGSDYLFYAERFYYKGKYINKQFSAQKTMNVEKGKKSANNAIAKFEKYAEEGKHKEALSCLLEVLDENPENANLLSRIGLAYAQIGLSIKAEEFYKKAIIKDPDNVGVYNNMGVLYLKQGKYGQAESYLRQALINMKKGRSVDKTSQGIVHSNYGHVIGKLGRIDEAKQYLKRAEELGTDTSAVKKILGIPLDSKVNHVAEKIKKLFN